MVTQEITLNLSNLEGLRYMDNDHICFEVRCDLKLEELLSKVEDRELRDKLFEAANQHGVLKVLKGCII